MNHYCLFKITALPSFTLPLSSLKTAGFKAYAIRLSAGTTPGCICRSTLLHFFFENMSTLFTITISIITPLLTTGDSNIHTDNVKPPTTLWTELFLSNEPVLAPTAITHFHNHSLYQPKDPFRNFISKHLTLQPPCLTPTALSIKTYNLLIYQFFTVPISPCSYLPPNQTQIS